MAAETIDEAPTDEAPLHVDRRYRLSRHLLRQPDRQGLLVRSLITGHHELLASGASVRVLLSMLVPTRLGDLVNGLDPARSSALCRLLDRWLRQRLITEIAEDGTAAEDIDHPLDHWEWHDLAFHMRSRRGRNPAPVGATWRLAQIVPPEPLRRPRHADVLDWIDLPRPDMTRLLDEDWPLTRVLESCRSRYGSEPVTLQDLGELLFRACRVTRRIDMGDKGGELIQKVHPSGGSLHSLETYLVAHRCAGIPPGGYHYDPFDHRLAWLRREDDELLALLADARTATVRLQELPSVLLIFASRFKRVTRKYESLAYHVILQEVGALYQTIYR